jgi:hypothetical protein
MRQLLKTDKTSEIVRASVSFVHDIFDDAGLPKAKVPINASTEGSPACGESAAL